MNNFEAIFTEFVRHRYPAADVVADILKNDRTFKNADFFFNNREIVLELKCLEEEKYADMHKVLQGLLNKNEIAPFSKGMTIGQALKGHPKEGQIRGEILNKITSSLESALEKANRQIRETKKAFGLQRATGVALVVNVDNTILEPQIATSWIHRLILKPSHGGGYRYEELSMIIYISHVHYQPDGPGKAMMPFVVMLRTDEPTDVEKDFLENFKIRWGEFMGLPVSSIDGVTSGDLLKKGPFLSKEKDELSLLTRRKS